MTTKPTPAMRADRTDETAARDAAVEPPPVDHAASGAIREETADPEEMGATATAPLAAIDGDTSAADVADEDAPTELHAEAAPVHPLLYEPDPYEPDPTATLDEDLEDADATMPAPALNPAPADDGTPQRPLPPEDPQHTPRKPTLAAAFNRPPSGSRLTAPLPPSRDTAFDDEIGDEVENEVDEWALADQPTVYLPPRVARRARPAVPPRAQTPVPYRPAGQMVLPQTPQQGIPVRPRAPQTPQLGVPAMPAVPAVPAVPRRDTPPHGGRDLRTSAPVSRPGGGAPSAGLPHGTTATPSTRMQRFQQLRSQRMAHAVGARAPQDARPIADIARQWWSDLRPGLANALDYQREARASGVHPIPAHVSETTSRLGDAFGRFAASAKEMTERAHAVAGPALKLLHDRAEQAAQAIVGKLEGPPTRQQAPLLGPGRIAVFFEDGVSIGQAQSLLIASRARPIRLIPRKHGFLALVPPGAEAETGKRLKEHLYVRDVAYLEYDEYGQPVEPR